MLRPALVSYLEPLFKDGARPSGADFKSLIEGLGFDTDRPRIVCYASGSNIPDDLLLTSTWTIPNDGTVMPVINVLCDYFHLGCQVDCIGVCNSDERISAYYFVSWEDTSTSVYTIYSIQFNNPGFNRSGLASESCVRFLKLVYNRESQTLVSSDARLLLTSLSGAITSNDVQSIKVVTSDPPMQEDGVLYIQMPSSSETKG